MAKFCGWLFSPDITTRDDFSEPETARAKRWRPGEAPHVERTVVEGTLPLVVWGQLIICQGYCQSDRFAGLYSDLLYRVATDGRSIRRRTGIQGCFLRVSLRAHRTIRPSTIREVILKVTHQRNTSPTLHPVQRI